MGESQTTTESTDNRFVSFNVYLESLHLVHVIGRPRLEGMSANINVTNTDAKKKILLVAANPSMSTVTQWPVGFWWAELTHPYWAFTEAGYDVEIRSPVARSKRTASATPKTRAAIPHTTS